MAKIALNRPCDVEVAKTTKGIVIGRVRVKDAAHSPWFQLKDYSQGETDKLAEWWVSGAALANIMLR